MIKLPAQKDAHEAPKTTSQLSNIIWYDNQSYQWILIWAQKVTGLHA